MQREGGDLPDLEEGEFMHQSEPDRTVLRRELDEPLVPNIEGPYQPKKKRPATERETIPDLGASPLTDAQKKMVHSIRAHQHLRRGRDHAAAGDGETAILAFKAALHEVLKSEEPGDIDIRRSATQELLRIIQQESAE